jgi:hypothetical protein
MSFPILCGHREPGQGWFRLFGYGIAWKDRRRHELLFSERYGFRNRLHVGPWLVGWLSR